MYLAKKLPYSYSSLEPFIDEETMFIHYNKHYLTYLKNLNEAVAKEKVQQMTIHQLIKTIDNYSTTIRNNAGGYYNHSLFWEMLKPQTSRTNPPYGLIKKVIDTNFNGYANFQSLLNAVPVPNDHQGFYLTDKKKIQLQSHFLSTP